MNSADHHSGVMATFTFQVRKSDKLESFNILPAGQKKVEHHQSLGNAGCGRTIDWSKMSPVPLPPEFDDGPISTRDISVVPQGGENIRDKVGANIKKITGGLSMWGANGRK